MKKLRQPEALLLLPLASIIVLALWYVATGFDLIPGDHGGRWFTLTVISVICLIIWGIIAVDDDDH